MITIFRNLRGHKSTAALAVAGLYFAVAVILAAIALFGDNDGGTWIFMDWIYWPASVVVGWLRESIKMIIPSNILHESPSPALSILNIFDASCCIIIGSIWYYLVVRTLSFIIVNASTGFRRNRQR